MTYEMQRWSNVLSEVPLEKGPPYPTGMFFTFNRLDSLEECVKGFERIADPSWGGGPFKPEEYRIVLRNSKGRVFAIADCYGQHDTRLLKVAA